MNGADIAVPMMPVPYDEMAAGLWNFRGLIKVPAEALNRRVHPRAGRAGTLEG